MDNQLQISPLEQSFKKGFTSIDELLDFIEVKMVTLGTVDREARERMSPGLYTREYRGKAGDIATSLIHKTEHQFIVSQGSCAVFIDGQGWNLIEAPFHGITKPGTRRLLYFFEDTIWTTMHPVPVDMDIDDVRSIIIEERENSLLNKKLS